MVGSFQFRVPILRYWCKRYAIGFSAKTTQIDETVGNRLPRVRNRHAPFEKRFRQPRGGTCWEPQPMNAKGLSTWISEVPPNVVAHPPFGAIATAFENCTLPG
jgi:hypothetical protein